MAPQERPSHDQHVCQAEHVTCSERNRLDHKEFFEFREQSRTDIAVMKRDMDAYFKTARSLETKLNAVLLEVGVMAIGILIFQLWRSNP